MSKWSPLLSRSSSLSLSLSIFSARSQPRSVARSLSSLTNLPQRLLLLSTRQESFVQLWRKLANVRRIMAESANTSMWSAEMISRGNVLQYQLQAPSLQRRSETHLQVRSTCETLPTSCDKEAIYLSSSLSSFEAFENLKEVKRRTSCGNCGGSQGC